MLNGIILKIRFFLICKPKCALYYVYRHYWKFSKFVRCTLCEHVWATVSEDAHMCTKCQIFMIDCRILLVNSLLCWTFRHKRKHTNKNKIAHDGQWFICNNIQQCKSWMGFWSSLSKLETLVKVEFITVQTFTLKWVVYCIL